MPDTLSSRTNYTKGGSTKSFIELQTNTVKTFEHVTDCYRGTMITKTHSEPSGYICTFNNVLLNNVLHYKSVSETNFYDVYLQRCQMRAKLNDISLMKEQFFVTHGYIHFYRRQIMPILNRPTIKCVMFYENTRRGNFFVDIFRQKVCL